MKSPRPGFSRRAFLSRAALLAAAAATPVRLGAQGAAKRIILDVDVGIDDAFAVLLAHYSSAIDLVGLTTVFGNATLDDCTRNTLYIKERFGIPAGVHRGAAAAFHHPLGEPPAFVHGVDGLGDFVEDLTPSIAESEVSAPEHIVRTVMDNPGEITVVTVGPVTNLMMARLLEPAIVENVAGVVVMGGAVGFGGELGNATTVGEANAWNDAHALDALFRFSWPTTMVGLDVTYAADAAMDDDYVQQLRRTAGDAGTFLEGINRKYRSFYRESRGVDVTFQHDSIALAYVIAPELFETRRGKLRVQTDGVGRGQTVFCPEGHHEFDASGWKERPAHLVCSGIDGRGFLALYGQALANAA